MVEPNRYGQFVPHTSPRLKRDGNLRDDPVSRRTLRDRRWSRTYQPEDQPYNGNRLGLGHYRCPFGFDFPYTLCNFSTSPCKCYDKVEGIRLDCHGRYLTSIPTLEDVPHERVISLNVNNNEIMEVSKKDFHTYSALQCIDLGNNRLTILPEDVFSNSKNLSAIFISGNLFTKIPEQIFPYNRNIEVISLIHIGPDVKIATLGKNWAYLTRLRELPLTGVTITTRLDKHFLSNLDPTGVSNVEIVGSYIPELYGEGTFEDLPNLTNLTLSRLYNLNNDMTRKVLWGMNKTNLHHLELEGNALLGKVYAELFEGLHGTKLDYLSLSFSLITFIKDGAFYHIPNLLTLILVKLPITHISNRTFMCLDKLTYLTIDSCDLLQIDYAFMPLRSLLYLDLSNNRQLEQLTTKAFKNLHSLKKLSIKYLHLDEFYNYTFADLGNLTLLDASFLKPRHNPYLHFGKHAFHGLANLLQLNLKAANIAMLQREYFEPLSKVHIIQLRGNNFIDSKVSRDVFQPIKRTMCRLDLEESNINKYMLGKGFLNDLPALRDLKLGNNNLRILPNNSFVGCSQLQSVDLHHNRVTHIPYALKITESLTILSLHNNKISYINDSAPYYDLMYLRDKMSSTGPEGFHFMLSQNPYNCSCAMVKTFIQWFNETNILDRLWDNPSSYICSYAPFKEMLAVPLIKFNKTLCMYFQEPDNHMVVILSITVGVVYFMVSTFVIFCYVFRWDISWLFFVWRWRRIEEDGGEEFEYDAFICYSSKDYKFVRYQLIENLEENTSSHDDMEPISNNNESQDKEYFRLAIDFLLFLPGGLVSDYIIDYMNRSRKTIILVSQNFLDGNWTMWEYQLAQSRALGRRDTLIVVLLESVPMRKMPRGLNKLIKDRAHIEWTDNPNGQEVFWRKMRKALQKPVPCAETVGPGLSSLSERSESPRQEIEYQICPQARNPEVGEELIARNARCCNLQGPLYTMEDPQTSINDLV